MFTNLEWAGVVVAHVVVVQPRPIAVAGAGTNSTGSKVCHCCRRSVAADADGLAVDGRAPSLEYSGEHCSPVLVRVVANQTLGTTANSAAAARAAARQTRPAAAGAAAAGWRERPEHGPGGQKR